MFEFKIENVANTLIKLTEIFGCTIEVAWSEYMHSLITEQFTLEEVLNYMEMQEKDF